MQTSISQRKNFYKNYHNANIIEFLNIVKDLLENTTVQQMKNYRQHYDSSCYSHCLEVAYLSYLMRINSPLDEYGDFLEIHPSTDANYKIIKSMWL